MIVTQTTEGKRMEDPGILLFCRVFKLVNRRPSLRTRKSYVETLISALVHFHAITPRIRNELDSGHRPQC